MVSDPSFVSPTRITPYSIFSYSNLSVNKTEILKTDSITISIDVTNNSEIAGKEVVQVYISDSTASITPSVKRLRAFRKVNLNANETKRVQFKLPISDLAFVDVNNKWKVEEGYFKIEIANNRLGFVVK